MVEGGILGEATMGETMGSASSQASWSGGGGEIGPPIGRLRREVKDGVCWGAGMGSPSICGYSLGIGRGAWELKLIDCGLEVGGLGGDRAGAGGLGARGLEMEGAGDGAGRDGGLAKEKKWLARSSYLRASS